MTEVSKDTGIAMALLERMRTQRLPRAFALKEKVDRRERLDDGDLAFLREVFETVEQIKPMVDRHPEYQDIYCRALHLYKEITDKALENEKSAHTMG
jgi:hypothetical protein